MGGRENGKGRVAASPGSDNPPPPRPPAWNSGSSSDPVVTISIRLHLRQRPVSTHASAFNSLHTGGASVHVWDGRGRRGGDGGGLRGRGDPYS